MVLLNFWIMAFTGRFLGMGRFIAFFGLLRMSGRIWDMHLLCSGLFQLLEVFHSSRGWVQFRRCNAWIWLRVRIVAHLGESPARGRAGLCLERYALAERIVCMWVLEVILMTINCALSHSFEFVAAVSFGLFLKNFKEIWLFKELNCILNQNWVLDALTYFLLSIHCTLTSHFLCTEAPGMSLDKYLVLPHRRHVLGSRFDCPRGRGRPLDEAPDGIEPWSSGLLKCSRLLNVILFSW